jgi:hypothetical protein
VRISIVLFASCGGVENKKLESSAQASASASLSHAQVAPPAYIFISRRTVTFGDVGSTRSSLVEELNWRFESRALHFLELFLLPAARLIAGSTVLHRAST